MAKAKLVHFTGMGNPDPLYAARLLVFTKGTRLEMSSSMEKINSAPAEEIEKELKYMATTIPSSWEFVDVVFLLTGVSRALAQQITRTRTASFAMQSQRVTDMSNVGWDKVEGDSIQARIYNAAVQSGIDNYRAIVDAGMPLEDAREVLPIGVHCNLVAKYNLRSFVDLCRARNSLRVQGAYVDLVDKMKKQLIEVWPWVAPFFVPSQQMAIDLIEEVAIELKKLEATGGAMYNGLSGKLAKAADKLKKD